MKSIKNKKGPNNKVLIDIRTLYQSYKEDYYKPVRIGNAFSSNYIEYESNGDKDKTLFTDDYLDIIKQYLSDIINDYKTEDESEIRLIMIINFIFCKDSNETCTMHTKCDNIEIMIGNETDEIIKKHFESLLHRYQEGLGNSIKGSEFIFDSFDSVLQIS